MNSRSVFILFIISIFLFTFVFDSAKSNAATSTTLACPARTLSLGSTGTDVTALQKFLNQFPDTKIASSGVGSPGKESTYFGPATKRALIKYQEKNASKILAPAGLKNGTGTFGPSTRAAVCKTSQTKTTATTQAVIPIQAVTTNTATTSIKLTSTSQITTEQLPNQYVTVGQNISFVLKSNTLVGVHYKPGFTLPTGATFDTNTNIFSWNPIDSQAGTAAFTFEAYDNSNTLLGKQNVTISVLPKNSTDQVTQTQNNSATTTTNDAQTQLAAMANALVGDGITDNSSAIQSMIDFAYTNHLPQVTLPSGNFRIVLGLHIYGTNFTFAGQGDSTIISFDNNFHGGAYQGTALTIQPVFDAGNDSQDGVPLSGSTEIYNPSQEVTGNTIVFNRSVPFTVGEKLLLYNGKGSTLLLEKRLGGQLNNPNLFQERAPIESVIVQSVAQNSSGQSIVTLQNNIIGTGEYFNVLPAGSPSSENYLTVLRLIKPSDNITVKNLAIKFLNLYADTAMYAFYTYNLTIDNIHVLNKTSVGGYGAIGIVGTTNAVIKNVNSPASIGLNSSRNINITSNNVAGVSMEETVTDTVIQNNTLGAPGNQLAATVRTNDLACNKISIINNNIYSGALFYGGIGIWEGRNITIASNNIHDGDGGSIWLGGAPGSIVHDNTALHFNDYAPTTNNSSVYNNSWQTVSYNQAISSMVANTYQSMLRGFMSLFGF